MLKEEALTLFNLQKPNEWNAYRKSHPEWKPDLHDEDLSEFNFSPNIPAYDFSNADLRGTKFPISPYQFNEYIDLSGAIIDVKTVFPKGFNPISRGAIFVSKAQHDYRTSKIFISYAWANEDVVLAIDYWLRRKNLETKIDKRDFFAGSRIRDEIMRIMKECDIVLIFYSKDSKNKPWPEFERELASDLEMEAKKEGKKPPRIIYIVIDDTPFPTVTEANRIAIMAKGKRFELVCEELYHHILQVPKKLSEIDLMKWENYVF